MKLTEQQKQTVLDILSKADGEDFDDIIRRSYFKYYVSHSVILNIGWEDLNQLLSLRRELKGMKDYD